MRRYLRHPVDIPIELYPATSGQPRLRLRNYSFGGLCCSSPRHLTPGTAVDIEIPDIQPPSYYGKGVVAWCVEAGGYYEVGIRFATEQEAFESRMAEQMCHIESYRRRVSMLEGRELSPDEAAYEWVSEYAQRYPRHNLFEQDASGPAG
ncbi:MAG TPA: PilZ domain-containing protein [Pseudomonadales bacterium]|nr:PilZ domain-containing protein [Pseudomonadales bacterium]